MKNEKQINGAHFHVSFLDELRRIVWAYRAIAYRAINYAQVEANWLLGKRIVEQEQDGEERAEYGKRIIEIASQELTKEFGKGFSESNIKSFRKFYLEFSDLLIQQTVSAELQSIEKEQVSAASPIRQTVSAELENKNKQTLSIRLSWSHYERLMRVDNKQARQWYLNEAADQMWSFRNITQLQHINYDPK